MERLAGMLFSPRKYTKQLATEPISWKKFLLTFAFVQLLSIYLGIIVMFTFLYPELHWFPDAIKSGPSMYIITLGDPFLLGLLFAVGYLLITIINFLFFGLIHYGLGKLLARGSSSNSGNLKGFYDIYGLSLVPLALFGVFNIFWIYFFEKINYASVNFPFVDFTLPVTIYFSVLMVMLLWRWVIQIRINQQYFNLSKKKSLVPILVHILFLGIIVIVAIVFGNQLALQFA